MTALAGDALLDALADRIADRVADRVAARLTVGPSSAAQADDAWLDTGAAAEHVGMHRDTLRKLAAQRRVPYEQEGPGHKLYFRRSDLDRLRAGGFHAASTAT